MKRDLIEAILFIERKWRRQKLPLVIFVGMCLNLMVTPAVYAAGGGKLEPYSAWALGILGLVTLALIIYLFVVVFQPEKF
ncbi:MAG: K(+)-transporting ATPase subunit F [Nostocaceae cyanobacterium]|nr:K(+)-transporting ATPase subunit F [Nostocaceae cyanobacterium]